MNKLLLLLLICLALGSCSTLPVFHQSMLQKENMRAVNLRVNAYEGDINNYREGASGADVGKSGGGCGCY